jgi:hypothetical protein
LQAASKFFAPFGIAQAEPPRVLIGWPCRSVNGVEASSRPFLRASSRTLTYQFSIGITPSWS